MQPIQVWWPRLGGSVHRRQIHRDSSRAFQHWQGELSVWMVPDFPALRRWQDAASSKLAVPAERLEWIDIVHVSEEGYIYAPTRSDLPLSVDGLLGAWLNLNPKTDCEYSPMPQVVRVNIPEV